VIVLGVDPGVTGALVALDTELGALQILDMPTGQVTTSTGKTRMEINEAAMVHWIKALQPDQAMVERVGAAPGQGVVSMFRFGMSYGVVRGVLAALGISTTLVQPSIWRRTLGVSTGKDGSRLRASQLFPLYSQHFSRVKDHGRADAALIAKYGAAKLLLTT